MHLISEAPAPGRPALHSAPGPPVQTDGCVNLRDDYRSLFAGCTQECRKRNVHGRHLFGLFLPRKMEMARGSNKLRKARDLLF